MRLDDQALGAIMMALQKSLMEQTDIVPVLKSMEFVPVGPSQSQLTITNPPVVHFDEDLLDEFTEAAVTEEEQLPHYTYRCDECGGVFAVFHSMKEKLTDCEDCELTDTLERVPSSFSMHIKEKPAGKVVKSFIEDAREEVKEEKKKMTRVYES